MPFLTSDEIDPRWYEGSDIGVPDKDAIDFQIWRQERESYWENAAFCLPDFVKPGDILMKPERRKFTVMMPAVIALVLAAPQRFCAPAALLYGEKYFWRFDVFRLGASPIIQHAEFWEDDMLDYDVIRDGEIVQRRLA